MLEDYLPGLFAGLWMTLKLAALALLFAMLLGLMGAAFRLAKNRPLALLAELYSTMVRGIPDLVWMFILFFGGQMLVNDIALALGLAPLDIDAFIAGALTLGFIFGAYMSETFRGAMLAVPPGQIEAGHAYGMSRLRVFCRIMLPQMVRFALPGFSNNWLVLVKSTALVSVIGLDDMMARADVAKSVTQQPFTVYLCVALLYLAITSISMLALNRLCARYSLGIREAEL
ncbi:ABC transporter permease [Craterilacuibacter sinensis]|uniref:ABC transporter permease subunit n=1 Tax=Craterilacuibacter sinensis TaxID=2686017 RepID=A0A845BSL4_9NEIS|nr:ABC transporter permease subunit [Craterilacuibacter sinensis]MXR38204.1 ABC transporter permease subunit [Craterilacuibacter sinensis]